MATLTFTGADASGHVNAYGDTNVATSITVSGIPSGAVINSVTFNFAITWSNSRPYRCQCIYNGYTYSCNKDNAGGNDNTIVSTAGDDAGNALKSYVTGNGTYTFTLSFYDTAECYCAMNNPKLIVDYTIPYTACTAPTSLNLSANNVAPGASVTLSWSGAKAGTSNAITGYHIYRATSASGSYTHTYTVSTSATSGSVTVTAPSSSGSSYYFKVYTIGSVSGYNSGASGYVALTALLTAAGAPTSCSVAVTITHNATKLNWSGATAGTNNAISAYEVQRCESTDGAAWGSWAALTTTSSTSADVAPPSTYGNYYKYRVRTQGTAGSSYYSGWKESSNTLRRDHAPLDPFTDTPLVAGDTPVKAIHMTEMQEAVNYLRTFYGLTAYTFTAPVYIADWQTGMEEIKAAVDGIGKSHDEWVTIAGNCPSVEAMHQLREVILAI